MGSLSTTAGECGSRRFKRFVREKAWRRSMAMEGMRDLLRGSLGRSLYGMREEDKLAAAWPVACGRAMAERGTVVRYVDGVILVEVTDGAWLRQMMSMQRQLIGEIGRIAGVKVREIHFEVQDQTKKDGRR
jgi:hypothetical protein